MKITISTDIELEFDVKYTVLKGQKQTREQPFEPDEVEVLNIVPTNNSYNDLVDEACKRIYKKLLEGRDGENG
jgi:hypothetical protein